MLLILVKHVCMLAKSLQLCPTLCDPRDHTQPARSGLPWPPSGDLPHQRTEPMSPESLALTGRFFTTSTTWEAFSIKYSYLSMIFSSLLFYYINDFIKYFITLFSSSSLLYSIFFIKQICIDYITLLNIHSKLRKQVFMNITYKK